MSGSPHSVQMPAWHCLNPRWLDFVTENLRILRNPVLTKLWIIFMGFHSLKPTKKSVNSSSGAKILNKRKSEVFLDSSIPHDIKPKFLFIQIGWLTRNKVLGSYHLLIGLWVRFSRKIGILHQPTRISMRVPIHTQINIQEQIWRYWKLFKSTEIILQSSKTVLTHF